MATKKKKKISVRLPNKLGKMLTKALDDLEWVEKNPKYKVNMGAFAKRKSAKGICEVCLGGTQLIDGLPSDPISLIDGDSVLNVVSDSLARKMFALDNLRQGRVGEALAELENPDPKEIVYGNDHALDRDVEDYHTNPRLWKAQMRLLAVELEQANI